MKELTNTTQTRLFAIELCIMLLKEKRDEISIKELLSILENVYRLEKENPLTYYVFKSLYKELVEKTAYGFLKLKFDLKTYEEMKKEELKLKEARKCWEQMIPIEEKLVKGEINLETFLIYLGALERKLARLNTCYSKYWAQKKETIDIFHQNGLYHPYNKEILIEFKERDADEALNEEIRKFVMKKHRYRNVKIRGKQVWGIGYGAITLVDKIVFNKECAHPRNYLGKKTFHNYFYKTGKKSSYDDGIEIMRELKDKYGE